MCRNIYPQPQRCYQTMVSTVSLRRSHNLRAFLQAEGPEGSFAPSWSVMSLGPDEWLGFLLGDWLRLPDGRVMTYTFVSLLQLQ